MFDIVSISYDAYQLAVNPSKENAAYLVADVGLAFVPFVPAAVGPAARAGNLLAKIDEAINLGHEATLARAVNRGQTANSTAWFATTTGFMAFKSKDVFESVLGKAGQGRVWHHIVEQRESLIQRFGAENIHNANNMVNVPAGINQKIADYYSSVDRRFHPTLTVRKWLETQSYEEQYAFGVIPLQRFLSSPRRRRKDPLMTYVEGALENGLALETGDVKGSKRSARKINQALKELAEDRSGLIEPLRTLLRHESHWVRGIAASDLLYVDQEPIEAVRVLEAIGSDVTLPFPGRIGASYAVKEWREGKRGPHAGGHPILTK